MNMDTIVEMTRGSIALAGFLAVLNSLGFAMLSYWLGYYQGKAGE